MRRQQSETSSDFINAKIRGMRSRLFEAERLSALTESRTLPELFRRLYPTETFEGHMQFESHVVRDSIRQLDRVLGCLSGPTFSLFEWLMVGFEVENIKVAMRCYVARENRTEAQALMIPLPRWMTLPADAMFDAQDLAHFVRGIPEPHLQLGMSSFVRRAAKPDPFSLDMALDQTYLRRLKYLAAQADEWPRKLAGFDMGRRDLLLLLRARFNFHRNYADVLPYLTHAVSFLGPHTAQQIFDAADLQEATRRIPDTVIPADQREGTVSLTRLEDLLLLQQYRLAVRCFTESVLDHAAAVAYFYMKQIETINLIRLTESIRHSLPREEVESMLLKRTR